MKKYGVIGVGLIVIAAVAFSGYTYLNSHKSSSKEHYKRDPNLWEVPPVAYSMKGLTFAVPETNIETILNLVEPTATYDYPRGEFAVASSSMMGELVAYDKFATPIEGDLQAVPISVNTGSFETMYYLAILKKEGDTFKHIKSVLLGDRIIFNNVVRDGLQVTVSYKVHDRAQPFTEKPTIDTTAIIDIGNGTFVQEGRKPWLEEDTTVRQIVGRYLWRETVKGDGTKVTPSKPDVFSLQFSGTGAALGTDCNSGGTEVKLPTGTSSKISFGAITASKMFCSSTEEGPYFETFGQIESFTESDKGLLTFNLKDKGTMSFVKEGQKLEFEATTTAATTTATTTP